MNIDSINNSDLPEIEGLRGKGEWVRNQTSKTTRYDYMVNGVDSAHVYLTMSGEKPWEAYIFTRVDKDRKSRMGLKAERFTTLESAKLWILLVITRGFYYDPNNC